MESQNSQLCCLYQIHEEGTALQSFSSIGPVFLEKVDTTGLGRTNIIPDMQKMQNQRLYPDTRIKSPQFILVLRIAELCLPGITW